MMRQRFFYGGMLMLMGLQLSCAKADRRYAVVVERFLFDPDSLAIQPGDTVTFTNRDAVPHTATSVNRSWDTGEIAPGDSARVVVGETGEYYCAYHPTMKGVTTEADD